MPITAVTESAVLRSVDEAVTAQRPTVFVGLYASLFRQIAGDEHYAELVSRSVTYPDGQGVVTELHNRGVVEAERLATTDLAIPVAGLAAERGWRVALYGGEPGVAARAAERLREAAPELEVVATWDGYTGGPTTDELRAAEIDVLFIGLGAARQETWAYRTGTSAGVPAMLTCGGLFDFLAGDKRRAPRWMQRAGLEWAFRVALEPRRLFRRYLLGNGYFLRQVRSERARLERQGAVVAAASRTGSSAIAASEPLAHNGAA